MSTKSAKDVATKPTVSSATEAIEVRLKGQGVTTVGLVDSNGNVLLSQRIVVSGSDEIEAAIHLPLSLSTKKGAILAVPVLFHQTHAQQVVTVGGKDPAIATTDRQRSLKLDGAAAAKIKAATEAAAAQIREKGRLTNPVRG